MRNTTAVWRLAGKTTEGSNVCDHLEAGGARAPSKPLVLKGSSCGQEERLLLHLSTYRLLRYGVSEADESERCELGT